jgi:hypothetical protein
MGGPAGRGRHPGRGGRAAGFVAALASCAVLVLATPAAAATPPSAPSLTGAAAGPTAGKMTVQWAGPADDGGAAVSGYELRVRVEPAGAWGAPVARSAATRDARLACAAPRTAGRGCAFQVRARNAAGAGPWSAVRSAVWAVPTEPQLVRATAGPSATQDRLSWIAPASNGGVAISSYLYEVDTAPGAWTEVVAPSEQQLDSGVVRYSTVVPCAVDNKACRYRVRAANAIGSGRVSAQVTAPLTTPSAPTASKARIPSLAAIDLATGVARVTVTWSPPAGTGGDALVRYESQGCAAAACGSTSSLWSSRPVTRRGLATTSAGWSPPATCPASGAQCAVRVRAVNSVGAGPWAHAMVRPARPSGLVGQPSSSTVGGVALSWSATRDPGAGGGHYVVFMCETSCTERAQWGVVVDDAGTATSVETTACPAEFTCRFRVGYVDSAGSYSPVTGAVTVTSPARPGPPENLTASASVTQLGGVDLAWDPPAVDGGQPVQWYAVARDNGSGMQPIALVDAPTTTYTDPGCGPGVECTYAVRAASGVGQSDPATASATGLADPVPPAVAVVAPAALATISDPTPLVSGTAGDAAGDDATVTVRVYAGALAAGTPVQTLVANRSTTEWAVVAGPLADGVYTVQAEQSDWAGNTGVSSPVTFTIDTAPPTVTITAPIDGSSTLDNTPTILGTAGDGPGDAANVIVEVYSGSAVGGTPVQTLSAPRTAALWQVDAATLPAGTYTVQARQSDSAGNTASSAPVTFTVLA